MYVAGVLVVLQVQGDGLGVEHVLDAVSWQTRPSLTMLEAVWQNAAARPSG